MVLLAARVVATSERARFAVVAKRRRRGPASVGVLAGDRRDPGPCVRARLLRPAAHLRRDDRRGDRAAAAQDDPADRGDARRALPGGLRRVPAAPAHGGGDGPAAAGAQAAGDPGALLRLGRDESPSASVTRCAGRSGAPSAACALAICSENTGSPRSSAPAGWGWFTARSIAPREAFERTVAVKLLHAHLAEQRSFIDAFRAEAELSARLVHPNIVQVLDFGRFGEAYFLAMEHVEGSTLGWLMRRLAAAQRVAPLTAVGWNRAADPGAASLTLTTARATPRGAVLHVVHRDLCPANVLVSASGAT
jgi:serine/threonine protein kinase